MNNVGDILKDLRSINEAKENLANKIPKPIKTKINKALGEFSKIYYPSLPIKKLFDLLDEYNIKVLQEDNTEFEGIFSGEKGRASLEIADGDTLNQKGMYKPYEDTLLVLTWYQLGSGNYEIVAYLS